jgi:hypothetical protein
MDEYLFIAVAKLKADRLKLEREQREALRAQHPRDDEPENTHRASARWFSRDPEWSKPS